MKEIQFHKLCNQLEEISDSIQEGKGGCFISSVYYIPDWWTINDAQIRITTAGTNKDRIKECVCWVSWCLLRQLFTDE